MSVETITAIGQWIVFPICGTAFLLFAIWIGNKQKMEKCEWTPDEDGIWETECDNLVVINEGTPLENDWVFCPYCGKVIQEIMP